MIQTIATIVRSAKIDLSSEKGAQADLAELLTRNGIDFEREYPLSKQDVIDFMVGGLGVELKLRGARKMDIYRQLKRYASHPRVESLALISNQSMGLPEQLEGKDVYFLKLGEGWI